MPKDLFSTQSDSYAKYRPSYPTSLIEYILRFVKERSVAWDCATGNGQVAALLADYFKKILATDISEKQLALAKIYPNIEYSLQSAEQTNFGDNSVDLITVAQAYHWFQFDAFEKEVRRVAKPGAVIAVWGYGGILIDENIDKIENHFYHGIVGAYWDKERTYIEENYDTVPFNFTPLPTAAFSINATWKVEDMIGFLHSWSSVQHFTKAKGEDPVDEIKDELYKYWKPGELKQVCFPLFLKLGSIEK